MIYQECGMCLEDSRGGKHTPLQWIGPDRDVTVCPVCDMLAGMSV
jgi:hypothetical protein